MTKKETHIEHYKGFLFKGAVFGGGEASFLFELANEVEDIGVATSFGDLCFRAVATDKDVFRAGHSHSD